MHASTSFSRTGLGSVDQGRLSFPAGFRVQRLCPQPATRRAAVTVRAGRYSIGGGSSYRSSPDPVDRVVSALPYILPFFDAINYGRYIFYSYPFVRSAIQPILPAIAAYHAIPFGGFITFFALYLGVANNTSLSRFVRFNAVQAILLDVLLVLPRLLETVLVPPTTGWGAQLYVLSQNFVWVFTTFWVVYGIATSLLGQWARIPFISEAAEQQLR